MSTPLKEARQVTNALVRDFILRFLEECCRNNPSIASLNEELKEKTSTHLEHWVEYLVMGSSPFVIDKLHKLGYYVETEFENFSVYTHRTHYFPRILTQGGCAPGEGGVALCVESISDFILAKGLIVEIEGSPFGLFRRACLSKKSGVSLWLIEKRGSRNLSPQNTQEGYLEALFKAKEAWSIRARSFEDTNKGMHRLHFLAKNLVETLGQDLATWVVMKAEESYWESKCFSAQIQGLRQSRLGLGWSNHLYHVFRSSRSLFPMLVRICETLGFSIQGASSAGVKEQWAVLCLRNFQAGFNLLIEVDAHPEELTESFGHTPLQDLTMEGPIDKWCRIHGDSILLGGMHHLAIRVMPSELTKATQAYNIKFNTLSPSSIYPFQYFTKEEECVRLEGVCQNNCSGSCLSCISFEHIDPLPLEQDKLYS